ncbi:MAG TPA: hypothetical protein DCQ83_04200 [Fibrobacteres bacterium]|nr:hypothetical protein [Fibrobacterota bacterium]
MAFVKRVLCYGDSNTWGFAPGMGTRYPKDTRWTGVLAKTLGEGYDVIEEGLNGRTTVQNDPFEEYRNGKDYLLPCLWSHQPLDMVVLMLGVNDLKVRFGVTAQDVAKGAALLVKMINSSGAGIKGKSPALLLMAPPPVAKLKGYYLEMFSGAEAKSLRLGEYYAVVAKEAGCDFLDTATVIVSSPLDGIHFDAGEHLKLGQAVARKVKGLIG